MEVDCRPWERLELLECYAAPCCTVIVSYLSESQGQTVRVKVGDGTPGGQVSTHMHVAGVEADIRINAGGVGQSQNSESESTKCSWGWQGQAALLRLQGAQVDFPLPDLNPNFKLRAGACTERILSPTSSFLCRDKLVSELVDTLISEGATLRSVHLRGYPVCGSVHGETGFDKSWQTWISERKD